MMKFVCRENDYSVKIYFLDFLVVAAAAECCLKENLRCFFLSCLLSFLLLAYYSINEQGGCVRQSSSIYFITVRRVFACVRLMRWYRALNLFEKLEIYFIWWYGILHAY